MINSDLTGFENLSGLHSNDGLLKKLICYAAVLISIIQLLKRTNF